MQRRTVLRRLAAGAGSIVGLAGTATAASNSDLPDLRGTDYRYRVTEDGLEITRATGEFDTADDCSVGRCCTCPEHCGSYCECLNPC